MLKKHQQILILASSMELLDLIFKYLSLARLPEGGRVSFPIGLALHKNPGIAFDIEIPLPIIILLTLVVVIGLTRLAKHQFKTDQARSVAAIVIIIGALGNALDRIINGFTTDYLIILGRSAINLSDLLIIFGAIFLLWYNKEKKQVV